MKIAIIGYGKMGKLLHQLCLDSNHEVVSIIDNNIEKYKSDICIESLNNADVALEFTEPTGILERLEKIAKSGTNIVVGTSGWYDEIDRVKELAEVHQVGIIYGANFSIGMNIFFQMAEYLAKLTKNIREFDYYGYEEHHNMKKDKPSGTAKYISKTIKELNKNIREDFEFEAVRAGKKPGTHVLGIDGTHEFLEIKHLARERSAFVGGVVKSAEWINSKKGFYNFSDYFSEIFK